MGFNSGLKGLRNIGIINSTTRFHLVGSFYEFYVTMHGPMDIKNIVRGYIPVILLLANNGLVLKRCLVC
jgi:hypothetical protein